MTQDAICEEALGYEEWADRFREKGRADIADLCRECSIAALDLAFPFDESQSESAKARLGEILAELHAINDAL